MRKAMTTKKRPLKFIFIITRDPFFTEESLITASYALQNGALISKNPRHLQEERDIYIKGSICYIKGNEWMGLHVWWMWKLGPLELAVLSRLLHIFFLFL